MVPQANPHESINVLLSNADWAWPQAVQGIFNPLGVNALVADTADDFVRLVDNNRIHLAILDMMMGNISGLQTLKILRRHDRRIPCILLAGSVNEELLREALALHVFSVFTKPVDLHLLRTKMDQLFLKFYDNDLFSRGTVNFAAAETGNSGGKVIKKTVVRWILRRNGKEHDET